jgi:hypothetical protein
VIGNGEKARHTRQGKAKQMKTVMDVKSGWKVEG